MSFHIEVESGKTVKLPTAGKYCDRDIVVTATGSGGGYTEADLQAKYDEGKQAEYDAFWDAYQSDFFKPTLPRTNYAYAFSGIGWRADNFRPKYDINPTNATSMFQNGAIKDIYSWLDARGIELDFSQAVYMERAFYGTSIQKLRRIDCTAATTLSYLFAYSARLETIEALVVNERTPTSYNFLSCTGLKNLNIEGTIGQSGFNVQWSTKLDKESITSIVNALSTTTSGLSVTLSKTAVNAAFETSAGAANGSASAEWITLAGTKSNWTINLV